MSYIKAGRAANGQDIKLHYTDVRQGAPVARGSYSRLAPKPRRGLNISTRRVAETGPARGGLYSPGLQQPSKPWDGYDYDTQGSLHGLFITDKEKLSQHLAAFATTGAVQNS